MAAESASTEVSLGGQARSQTASSHWAQAWRRLRRDPAALFGGAVVVALVLIALFATSIAPYDYTAQNMGNRYALPGGANLLGTDHLGRDVLSRLMFGARISLAVGMISVGIAVSFGVAVGAVAGYIGGRTDMLLMWVMDLILAFPALLLAITIASALGPSVTNAMIAASASAAQTEARSGLPAAKPWPSVFAGWPHSIAAGRNARAPAWIAINASTTSSGWPIVASAATRSNIVATIAATPNVPCRLSCMIASFFSRSNEPPSPSHVSANPSS